MTADCANLEPAAVRFHDLVGTGQLTVPHAGRGATVARWRALARLAQEDLDVARLAEAHLDALGILNDLGWPDLVDAAAPDRRWAVWAAEPPDGQIDATCRSDGRWSLTGTKRWCSGAHVCTHALITARTGGGGRLFAVDLSATGVRPGRGGWRGVGMAGSGTEDVELVDVTATAVGPALAYLDRIGFWFGAIGVSACWFGGAIAIGRPLWTAGQAGSLDPHGRAHLGAVDAALAAAGAMLRDAATAADQAGGPAATDPTAVDRWRRHALQVRAMVENAALTTIDRVGRALGPGPLAKDARHSKRVTDLGVYLRQSHAERDLAVLGDLAASDDCWREW